LGSSGRLSWGFSAPPPIYAHRLASIPSEDGLSAAVLVVSHHLDGLHTVRAVGLLHPTTGHRVHRISLPVCPQRPKSMSHNRVSSRRLSPRRISVCDSRTASLRPSFPLEVVLTDAPAETVSSVHPPPRGLAPSHPEGLLLWFPAASATLSFLGLSPLRGPSSSAAVHTPRCMQAPLIARERSTAPALLDA
jgi:hypothetical protein